MISMEQIIEKIFNQSLIQCNKKNDNFSYRIDPYINGIAFKIILINSSNKNDANNINNIEKFKYVSAISLYECKNYEQFWHDIFMELIYGFDIRKIIK